jgi:class 3 adenylate cyclase
MFTREDIALLRTLLNQGAIALDNAQLFDEVAANLKQIQMLETVKGNLAKFVPQTVQDLVEESPDAANLFEKRETDLTVMFADMTGYTKMSSKLPMEEVNAIIERYFGAFLDEILRAGGDINETAGDGLMVLFQDPDPNRHARAAVSAAVGIQRLTRTINEERFAENSSAEQVGMHIGINTGVASVGATKISGGTGMRWTYTASGPITNIAARVGALGEEICITEDTRIRLSEGFTVEELGPQALKNVPNPVMAYRVVDAPRIAELDTPASAVPIPAEEHANRSGRFVILGKLSEADSGNAIEGLVVRGFDKDLLFDDYLGESRSDAEGRFEIRFTDEFFADLSEKHPDIYLKIFDSTGDRELLSTKRAVRWKADSVEHFDIEIAKHLIEEGG